VSFKIIMTTSVTRPSQHNTRPARPRPTFWFQTGLVLRPTVSDHITDYCTATICVVNKRFSLHLRRRLSGDRLPSPSTVEIPIGLLCR